MTIALTDADFKAALKKVPRYMRDTVGGREALLSVYRAGLERAAKECERVQDVEDLASVVRALISESV